MESIINSNVLKSEKSILFDLPSNATWLAWLYGCISASVATLKFLFRSATNLNTYTPHTDVAYSTTLHLPDTVQWNVIKLIGDPVVSWKHLFLAHCQALGNLSFSFLQWFLFARAFVFNSISGKPWKIYDGSYRILSNCKSPKFLNFIVHS